MIKNTTSLSKLFENDEYEQINLNNTDVVTVGTKMTFNQLCENYVEYVTN